MATKRADVPPEAAGLSRGNPDIRAVELLLPDLNAILRGKRVSRRELAGLFREGISFPATGILMDSRGSLIDGLAHGSDDGDPDYVCHARCRVAGPGALVEDAARPVPDLDVRAGWPALFRRRPPRAGRCSGAFRANWA